MKALKQLPPGQRAVAEFPRFGTHLHRPPPPVPDVPTLEIGGAVTEAASLPLADLRSLPRHEVVADFHCVAGWSATDLHWAGIAFKTFYEAHIAPRVVPGAVISHVLFRGLDGYESMLLLEDALAADVLIADRLDGRPLTADHGAPVRLVSPTQYGFISAKHLCRIEVHTSAAADPDRWSPFAGHRRARVWHEERHRYIPGRVIRPFYQSLIRPIRVLSARGSRQNRSYEA